MKIYLGRISIEDQEEIVETVRLTVENNNYEIEFSSTDRSYRNFRIIHGVFNGLGNLTFIDCRNISSETGSGADIRRYKANYTLINAQIENPNEFYFDSADITMPGLLDWTGLYSVDYKLNGDLSKNISLKKHDNLFIYENDSFSINIYASNLISLKRDPNQTTINEIAGFKIFCLDNREMNIWDFIEVFKELQKVLLILGNRKTDISGINFYKKDHHPVNFKSNEIISLGRPSTFGPALEFQDIKDNLQTIFHNWFSNIDIHTSIDLILEKSVNIQISRENFFLNNCFAIETFHRRFKNYRLFKKSEFKIVKKKILENIDNKDISKLVENSLAHINEPNFRSRLFDFQNEFDIILPEDWDTELYIRKIVKTRNYLVHRSSSQNIFDRFDMLYASFFIELIIKLSIFKTLDIEEKICDEVLRKTGERIRGFYFSNKRMRFEI